MADTTLASDHLDCAPPHSLRWERDKCSRVSLSGLRPKVRSPRSPLAVRAHSGSELCPASHDAAFHVNSYIPPTPCLENAVTRPLDMQRPVARASLAVEGLKQFPAISMHMGNVLDEDSAHGFWHADTDPLSSPTVIVGGWSSNEIKLLTVLLRPRFIWIVAGEAFLSCMLLPSPKQSYLNA